MMRTLTIALMAAVVVTLAAAAQNPAISGYNAMRIDGVGKLVGSFNGRIDEMSDGVRITLLSDNPEQKELPIKANSMKFSWAEGSTTPAKIVMTGNVEIQHPEASVTAEKAEWDFEKGELVFSGNPVMSNEMVKNMRGERMVLNFNTNSFEVTKVKVDQVPLNGMNAAGGAPSAGGGTAVLRDADIKDWKGLLEKIRAEAKSDAASPGKRLAAQLDAKVRQNLLGADIALLLDNKGALLKELNKALAKPGFYDAGAFAKVALDDAAKALIAKEKRSAEEETALNRALFLAAYAPFVN